MEIGEAVAGGEGSEDELERVPSYRLVDIHGNPVANLAVHHSDGAQYETDAEGRVESEDLAEGATLRMADGRRVIFGFPYYQGTRHDPGWIQHSLEGDDEYRRNGMCGDEDEVEPEDHDPEDQGPTLPNPALDSGDFDPGTQA